MTATFAPSPWPTPASAPRAASWAFGREIRLDDVPGAPCALQWRLLRNCSIAPRQLLWVYGLLSAVSMGIALVFFMQGAPLVLAFAGIELLALGCALLVFARHAADHETLTLVGRSLQVQQCFGTRTERADFSADWLTVEPAAGQGSLVELSGRGQRVRVGRFLRPELRAAFARELRLALRLAPVFAAPMPEAKTDTN